MDMGVVALGPNVANFMARHAIFTPANGVGAIFCVCVCVRVCVNEAKDKREQRKMANYLALSHKGGWAKYPSPG